MTKSVRFTALLPFLIFNLSAIVFVVTFSFFALDLRWTYVAYMLVALFFFILFYGFLRYKNYIQLANRSLTGWFFVFLISSHIVLGQREGVWRGFQTDPILGWYPQADMRGRKLDTKTNEKYIVFTDALGHRNIHPYPASRKLNLVLQGDSNAFGFGLKDDDTFCGQLELINPEPCFNFGVPGYDTQHFFYQYERITNNYEIDTRIILLNIGNDYSLSALKTPYLIRRPYMYLNEDNQLVMMRNIAMPFRKQVYGYKFLPPFEKYDNDMAPMNSGRDWGNWMPEWLNKFRLGMFVFELFYPRIENFYLKVFKKEALNEGNLINPYYGVWQLTKFEFWPEPFKSYWPHFEALLKKISQQKAKRTIIVMFPIKSQVLTSQIELEKSVAGNGTYEYAIDRFVLQRKISEYLENIDVTLIDVADEFTSYPTPKDLYQTDYHLSKEGMKLVVQSVSKTLEKN